MHLRCGLHRVLSVRTTTVATVGVFKKSKGSLSTVVAATTRTSMTVANTKAVVSDKNNMLLGPRTNISKDVTKQGSRGVS